jgi:ligand-binding sensor domain-containing protein/serine phosphatase RsbU (regulator of sigma subunit)
MNYIINSLLKLFRNVSIAVHFVVFCYVFFINIFHTYGNTVTENEATVINYTNIDGLSGNGITTIFQDSQGYIWIGTPDGLNKFDGYTFTVYRHEIDNLNSISGNHIQCITEDPEGNIWIGTIGNGLNKYDRKTNHFTTFHSGPLSSVVIPEDNILGVHFDLDSTLWVKTENYLFNMNPRNLTVSSNVLYSGVFMYLEKYRVPIYSYSDQYIWVATKDGLSQFNKNKKLYARIPMSADTSIAANQLGPVTSIVKLKENTFLIGGIQGLYHFIQGKNGTFKSDPISIPDGRLKVIHSTVQLSDGRIWIGTNSGLRELEYNEKENKIWFDSSSFFNQLQNQITNDEVVCLLEDNSGLLWVGTKYNGLLKVDFKPQKFKQVSKIAHDPKELKGIDILSIYVDEDKIWLGTAGKGLKILDRKTREVKSIVLNNDLHQRGEDMVLSLYEDSKAQLWIGTNKGIFIYNKKKGVIKEFYSPNNADIESLIKHNSINTFEEDEIGNIWIGTQLGLYRYDGQEIKGYFAEPDNPHSIASNEINALFFDSDSILWIGTTEGINYTLAGDELIQEFGISLLDESYILSICEDNLKRVWFGSRSGITYFDKKTNNFGYYSQIDGLANDEVNGIVCDLNNGVWLSTNKGVSLITVDDNILNYDMSDGLPGYAHNRGAAAITSSGEIYFGGVKGPVAIYPDSILLNNNKPNVIITSVEFQYKGNKVEKIWPEDGKISLKYRRNSILKLSFAVMEFTEPSKNMFQVFIDGFDDDWRPVTHENEINISNLPPGDYTLFLKGANNDRVWSDSMIKLLIEVEPPLWMSRYAYAFYLIAFIFLIQSIINYRIRHYKKAYKVLQENATDKKKIEAQKEQLFKINQNLTDSIFYAKRIQESILPSEKRIRQVFPESFVYFRSKDLVSGDFYWLHESGDKIFIATVDCTGHGVPGAFMSIIGYNMLKGIITGEKESCPAKILDQLSKDVISTFKKEAGNKDEDDLSVNDTMDIALCVIDKKEKKLTFAGAFNPLYLVRNNEVLIYKGDRFAIGYQSDENIHFSKHEIKLEKEDIIYIFSDGYADQFGGLEGKKFKYRRFRHLLLNIHKLSADEQKAILHQKLEDWMNDYDQVDDIIIMGMRPLV